MTILLDWLTTANNYAKWRGNGSGKTKEVLCSQMREAIAKLQTSERKYQNFKPNTTRHGTGCLILVRVSVRTTQDLMGLQRLLVSHPSQLL
jgi:hypothetical protein